MKKLIIVITVLSVITGLLLNNSKKLDTIVDVNSKLTLEDSSFTKTNYKFHNPIEIDDEIVDIEDNNIEVKAVNNNSQNIIENKEVIKEEQTNVNSNYNNTDNEKQKPMVTEKVTKEETQNNYNIEEKNANNNIPTEENIIEESNQDVMKEKTKEQELPNIKTNPKINRFQVFADTNKTVTLVDKSGEYCAQALDFFYEDNQYVYYFTCIKSGSMYVIKNGREYKLVEALKTGVTTIKELNENGYSFLKKN